MQIGLGPAATCTGVHHWEPGLRQQAGDSLCGSHGGGHIPASREGETPHPCTPPFSFVLGTHPAKIIQGIVKDLDTRADMSCMAESAYLMSLPLATTCFRAAQRQGESGAEWPWIQVGLGRGSGGKAAECKYPAGSSGVLRGPVAKRRGVPVHCCLLLYMIGCSLHTVFDPYRAPTGTSLHVQVLM